MLVRLNSVTGFINRGREDPRYKQDSLQLPAEMILDIVERENSLERFFYAKFTRADSDAYHLVYGEDFNLEIKKVLRRR